MFSLLAHSVGFGAATEKVVPRILPSPAVSAQTPKVCQRSCVSSTATVYHLQESLDLTGIFSWSGISRLFSNFPTDAWPPRESTLWCPRVDPGIIDFILDGFQ